MSSVEGATRERQSIEASTHKAARTAILYAFDLIEHDGEDLRDLPFLDRKAALARLLRDTKAGILLNEHIVEDGPTVACHKPPSSSRYRGSEDLDFSWLCLLAKHQTRRAKGNQRVSFLRVSGAVCFLGYQHLVPSWPGALNVHDGRSSG
jgi:hypothetical protein